MFSRMAVLQARWQISVMSAPEKPWVNLRGREGMGGAGRAVVACVRLGGRLCVDAKEGE
jgi:hypothetical protein